MAQSAAAFSLLNTDKISTMMGAPPHHWKVNEVQQIKQIHRCFRNAYGRKAELLDEVKINDHADDDMAIQFNENMTMVVKENDNNKLKGDRKEIGDVEDDGYQRDEEDFLPKDSPLRSQNGDKKVPANPIFKDYEAFINSCNFDFWRHHFELGSPDKFLSASAQSIVFNICMAQSRNQLRVKNGHVPLRKKREHITPLALVLHEIKLWATNVLRSADIYSEETYQDIRCRIRYLDALRNREVWGSNVLMFSAGMNATAHDKLFRLFMTAQEGLERGHEYALRGYNRRSSREKLSRVGNLLKDLVMSEMKMVSFRMTLTKKLEDPKTPRLQPNDLLNSIENMPFVDFQNMANVIIWRMCQEPLIAASLNGDYDKADVKASVNDLNNWTKNNLFCVASDSDDAEPDFRMDKRRELRMMPEVYRPSAAKIKQLQKIADPNATGPLAAGSHIKLLKKCFLNESAAAKIVKLLMKNLAAIQELIPSIFAMHQLWTLAGDGGDFTVYDTMKEQVIRVMTNAVSRVQAVKATGVKLSKMIAHLAKEKEELMNKEAIIKKKQRFKPAWVSNNRFITNELSATYEKTYSITLARLFELAKDARDYTLSTEVLDDKVEEAKKIFDAITGHYVEERNVENVQVKAGNKKADSSPEESWGHEDDVDSGEFGNHNTFGGFNDYDGESRNPFGEGFESDDE